MQHVVQVNLLKKLERMDPVFGEMYRGAIEVLKNDYAERIPQSALSIRELVEALLRIKDVTESNASPEKRQTTKKVEDSKKRRILKGISAMRDTLGVMPGNDEDAGELAAQLGQFNKLIHHEYTFTMEQYEVILVKMECLLDKITKTYYEAIKEIDEVMENHG